MTVFDSSIEKQNLPIHKIIIFDIIIFLVIYFLPSISHLVPFPLYLLEPMRIAVLLSYLMTKDKWNTSIIAVTLPLFSFFVTGHPVFFKSMLISFEFLANILLFFYLIDRTRMRVLIAMVVSILGSKLLYYFCKYIFIQFGLIEGGLVSTGILAQVIALSIISVVFALLYKVKYNK